MPNSRYFLSDFVEIQRRSFFELLENPHSVPLLLYFSSYCHLLQVRSAEPAFHPHGGQKILDLDPAAGDQRQRCRKCQETDQIAGAEGAGAGLLRRRRAD